MNHRLAATFAALLAVTSVLTGASACAEPVAPGGPPLVDILVGGTARPRYAHGGRWYVEALKGREYTIRLHNPYPVRVGVALSVDGLNTIDAGETSAGDARKWMIDPYGTIEIAGWQTSQSQARRFEFTTEARSYGQALGKTNNLGVITAVYFKERLPIPRMEFAPGRDSRERSLPGGAADELGVEAAPAPPSASADAGKNARRKDNEFAATGMGRATDVEVTEIWLDLEPTPAQRVAIRYEFRPQLVRLGILPAARPADPLTRRERAQGFCPEVD